MRCFVEAVSRAFEAMEVGCFKRSSVVATAAVAEFLGAKGQFGAVAEGQRADLILVSGNPFTDVKNAGRVDGVMLRGQWFSRGDVDRMVVPLVASYYDVDER
jgi:adenine deaminase